MSFDCTWGLTCSPFCKRINFWMVRSKYWSCCDLLPCLSNSGVHIATLTFHHRSCQLPFVSGQIVTNTILSA